MENLLRHFISLTGKINDSIGQTTAWLTTVLMLLVCGDVAVRYLLNTTAAWVMELEWHLFALVFLLGSAYSFKHDRHVRVDLFYDRFSKRDKAWVNLIGAIALLIPWCLVLIYASFQYALGSYRIGEGSPNPGGLPYLFIIKFSIPLGILLLLLQALASIAQSILVLRGNDEVNGSDDLTINEAL